MELHHDSDSTPLWTQEFLYQEEIANASPSLWHPCGQSGINAGVISPASQASTRYLYPPNVLNEMEVERYGYRQFWKSLHDCMQKRTKWPWADLVQRIMEAARLISVKVGMDTSPPKGRMVKNEFHHKPGLHLEVLPWHSAGHLDGRQAEPSPTTSRVLQPASFLVQSG